MVLKRGFRTRKEAAAALRAEIRTSELGEWVEPLKQRLDAYLAAWVRGQRLSPATLASYRKNIRLHIDPHLGAQPVAGLTAALVDAWMPPPGSGPRHGLAAARGHRDAPR